MKNITKRLDDYFLDCPVWIVNKSVEELKTILDRNEIEQIKEAHKEDPETWWALYHHGWGTAIRNFLRNNVCKDDELPSGNWDDYYIQVVELVCDVRSINE